MEVNERHNNAISILNNHVKYLQSDIEHKNTLINDLLDGLRNINKINNIPTGTTIEQNSRAEIYVPFKRSRLSNSKRHTVQLDDDIQLTNHFQPFQQPDDDGIETNKYMYNDDVNIITNNHASQNTTWNGVRATPPPRRPNVVVKNNPEKENYFLRSVPGKANYSDITKEGKKTCVIGASIVKRIDIREFNKFLDKGTAIKRSFDGAVASQLNYYIEEILNEEKVDRIIINIGTNNLTKKSRRNTKQQWK